MTFSIETSQLFLDQLRLLAEDQIPLIQSKIKILRDDPTPPGSKKRLRGTRNPDRYRIRAGDYRVIYSFDADTVQLWNVDKRSEVYVKNTDKGHVVVGPLDPDPTGKDTSLEVQDVDPVSPEKWEHYREQLHAWIEVQADEGPVEIIPEPIEVKPNPLVPAITHELLRTIDIPRDFHTALVDCRTDVDLLRAMSEGGVPADVVDRVFNVIAEPDYERVATHPRKQVKQIEDLTRFRTGKLIDFQVALDPAQKQIARSISRSGGPWLINGAAGTGKSTILLDAAIDIFLTIRGRGEQPWILVTTFTNALVRGLEEQLDRIFPEWRDGIDVRTVDSVMLDILDAKRNGSQLKKDPTLQGILRPIVADILAPDYEQASLLSQDRSGDIGGETITFPPLAGMSWEYLLDEIESGIVGRNTQEQFDYLTAPRPGRRVPLSETQRRRIWDISESLRREMEYRGWTTWARRRQRAADLLESGMVTLHYDAVFIDEAQDLQPNAIRMLVEVAKSAQHGVRDLYLAADANQTIYGSGVSWVSIHPDLKLTGRSRRIGTNHRSTRQIIEAARAYMRGAELDEERGDIEHRHVGPNPLVVTGLAPNTEIARIIEFFRAQCSAIGRDIDMCAVLVPTEKAGKRFQSALALRGMPARFMSSRNVDMSFPGVKIVTRHSAKGLEFPVVALSLTEVSHLNETDGDESTEARLKERRLNHMAMTRAMRSLLVTLPADNIGEFSRFVEPLWQVESVQQTQHAADQ